MGRFIILSGPSCVGKGPLHNALLKFYPESAASLRKLVLYNCRSPRPGEIDGKDYWFRPREEIETFRKRENFIVLDVRGDLQAVDLSDLDRASATGELLFEGNPFVGRRLQEALTAKVNLLTVFLSPLSRAEIVFLKSRNVSLPDFLTDVMRHKLLRRTQRQKGTSVPEGSRKHRTPRDKRIHRIERRLAFRLCHPKPRRRRQRELGRLLLSSR